MNIQREDVASLIITFYLLLAWYSTFVVFNYPLISISILWSGMIILSIVYSYVYKKNNRDMRILKIRFLVSAIPIYPILAYYVYSLIIGEGIPNRLRYLPFFVVCTMLFLNASVIYIYDKKKIAKK